MKRIKLTKGEYALVDNEIFEWLNQWKWQCFARGSRKAATRTDYSGGKKKTIYMHRLMLGLTDSKRSSYTDHANGNGLDNRRKNLRICNSSLNQANSEGHFDNKSGYKGVYWYKELNKWTAQIGVNKRKIFLGRFDDKKDAAVAYNNAAQEYFGDFARLNTL